ncbi:Octanoyltransferase [Candidatus Xenohaliotis californiensis]|uniref:Octanoyltransferase n=1 Tax=Candidatus Xenohaliotis californiensis TaxID=84677 RepID=A0ABP0EV77_9RICK|nr:Octanoyltransferase [Candidatus Xenohaliotis californiensis]
MVEWLVSNIIDYSVAMDAMEKRVLAIHSHSAQELIWLLEHSNVYTAGVSASANEWLDTLQKSVPVLKVARGGKYTYHGPGQRVVYPIIDLRKCTKKDIKAYVFNMEEWIIEALAVLGIVAFRQKSIIGVWVMDKNLGVSKIASIGIKVKKWIAYYGLAINVSPDLSFFKHIIPCGINGVNITSLENMGQKISMRMLDRALKEKQHIFLGSDR